MIAQLTKLSLGALILSAVGATACNAPVDDQGSRSNDPAQGTEAPSASANTVSTTAEVPTLIHSIPDEPVAAQERVKRPAEAISGPRDGHCVERADATGICSLASGRSHFFTCSAGGAPPRSLPDCKSAGGSTTWCCF